MLDIPALPGSYGLILRLAQTEIIQPGRLPKTVFPAGFYVYTGVARGPGGLRARLNRHLMGTGKLHWHIDWLRARAAPYANWFQTGADPLECEWIQNLKRLPGVFSPSPGFGASDCHAGCRAHLLGFREIPDFYIISSIIQSDIHSCE